MSSRLMQRKFSEPNTYIDGLPSQDRPELLYDDVEMSELTAAVRTLGAAAGGAVQSSCRQTSIPLAIGGVIPSHLQGPQGRNLGAIRLSFVLGRAVRLAWGLVGLATLVSARMGCAAGIGSHVPIHQPLGSRMIVKVESLNRQEVPWSDTGLCCAKGCFG